MRKYNRKILVPERTFEYLEEVLKQNYDLGRLSRAYLNDRGYININYEIETISDESRRRFYLKFYRWGVMEDKVRFEHQLLNELHERGFPYSPEIIKTTDGNSYARLLDSPVDDSRDFYITLFSFVGGNDKYIWNRPDWTAGELEDAARVLALYHSTIGSWQGMESKRRRAVDRLPGVRNRCRQLVSFEEESQFDTYLKASLNDIYTSIDDLSHLAKNGCYDNLPHLAVHGDYHPGNLKFREQKIAGVVDYDWSCMDARCFDVGLALYYFCTSWDRISDGCMQLEQVERFVATYQKEASRLGGIGPMNSAELQSLTDLIHLGGLVIVDWTVGDFTSHRSNPMEYLSYLEHGIRHLQWMRDNQDELLSRVKSCHVVS